MGFGEIGSLMPSRCPQLEKLQCCPEIKKLPLTKLHQSPKLLANLQRPSLNLRVFFLLSFFFFCFFFSLIYIELYIRLCSPPHCTLTLVIYIKSIYTISWLI